MDVSPAKALLRDIIGSTWRREVQQERARDDEVVENQKVLRCGASAIQ